MSAEWMDAAWHGSAQTRRLKDQVAKNKDEVLGRLLAIPNDGRAESRLALVAELRVWTQVQQDINNIKSE